jgi:hypothetical protein
MFTHPDPLGQLAAEHHRQMLAEARQRALRQQHGRRSSRTPNIALRMIRSPAASPVVTHVRHMTQDVSGNPTSR